MKKIKIDYDSPCRLRQEYGNKINELIDTVNKLQEYVQGVVDNSIKDGAYIQNLEEDVKALRADVDHILNYCPMDLVEKLPENTQNSTNNSEKLHLFQGNEQKVNKNAQKVNECEPEVKENFTTRRANVQDPVYFISTTYLSDNRTTVFYGQNGVSVEFNQPLPAGFIITIKENETKGGKDE